MARRCDKYLVSRFIANAVEILAAAESTMNSGSMPSDLTILISAEGGIHMVADSDWPLESLRQFHGSSAAYRVRPVDDKVRVEGRTGSQKDRQAQGEKGCRSGSRCRSRGA